MKLKILLVFCLMQFVSIAVNGQPVYNKSGNSVTIGWGNSATTINMPSHTTSSTTRSSSSSSSNITGQIVSGIIIGLLFNNKSSVDNSAAIQAAAIEEYNERQAEFKLQFEQGKQEVRKDLKGMSGHFGDMEMKTMEDALSYEPEAAPGEITTGTNFFQGDLKDLDAVVKEDARHMLIVGTEQLLTLVSSRYPIAGPVLKQIISVGSVVADGYNQGQTSQTIMRNTIVNEAANFASEYELKGSYKLTKMSIKEIGVAGTKSILQGDPKDEVKKEVKKAAFLLPVTQYE